MYEAVSFFSNTVYTLDANQIKLTSPKISCSISLYTKILNNKEEATLIVTHFVREVVNEIAWGDTSDLGGGWGYTGRAALNADSRRRYCSGQTARLHGRAGARRYDQTLRATGAWKFIRWGKIRRAPTATVHPFDARRRRRDTAHDPTRLILSTPINIDAGSFVLHGGFVPFY